MGEVKYRISPKLNSLALYAYSGVAPLHYLTKHRPNGIVRHVSEAEMSRHCHTQCENFYSITPVGFGETVVLWLEMRQMYKETSVWYKQILSQIGRMCVYSIT